MHAKVGKIFDTYKKKSSFLENIITFALAFLSTAEFACPLSGKANGHTHGQILSTVERSQERNKKSHIITMKRIEVVAAIIRKDGKIFATQRGYGEWQDWWEFPGGKIEAGETPEEALRREIREELSTEIGIDRFLCTVEYDYPAFHLTMHCYLCSLLSDTIRLNEHEAAKWLTKEQLNTVKWLPADKAILEKELYN